MRKYAIFILGLVFFSTVSVWAAGKKDNESREADNPAGFTERIDTSEKKQPKKYNFYLEAQDKGGNTTIVGPYNIRLDPESDKPVVSIANPRENMVIQGNLNIVGTCIDDDGVAFVELWFNDDESTMVRAEGKEFWSYYYDTTGLTDGVYSITARGVDINGLEGRTKKVSWNLDRYKPETVITSHPIGALVAGKVTLKGTVYDGNGVDNLSYSLDGGEKYIPVSIKYDKKADVYNYDFSVDTRNFEDGPLVVWFRAKDKMGTTGVAAHLLFVDNTGPDVGIVYPEPDEKVNGMFTVAGYAMDTIGLRSLSWKLGKESGEIPLVIGNPWWIQEFDIRGQKTNSLDLEIRAVDLSGNVTTAKRKLLVDQDADLPRVTLTEPTANAVLEGNVMTLTGFATDNDGVSSILYAFNGQTPVEIPCSGYFQQIIENIPTGILTLDVWAKDITNVQGPKVQVKGLIAPGPAPDIRIENVKTGTSRAAVVDGFYTGRMIETYAGAALEANVISGSALSFISWQFGNLDPVTVQTKGSKGGDYRQEIPIPRDIESGLVKLEIRTQDIYGQEAVRENYMYLSADGTIPNTAKSFHWVRPDMSLGDGRILISHTNEPLMGVYSGGPLRSASITGDGAENLSVRVDELGRLVLSTPKEGSFGPVSLNLTGVEGGSYQTGTYRFLVDLSDPAFTLINHLEGEWVQNRLTLKFNARDSNRIIAVEFSTNMGATWQPLVQGNELETLDTAGGLERTLDLSALQDGAITISIRVTDEAKRQTVRSFTVNKDTETPKVQLVVPISGARVNGTIRLGIAVHERGRISTIVYHRPARETADGDIPEITKSVYSASPSDRSVMPLTFLDVLMDSTAMPLDPNMSFIFTDAAGNSSVLNSWPFVIDNEMDIPVAEIVLPLENEVITTDFVVSGVAYDDDAIKGIYWRIDDGQERFAEASQGFSIPIALSSMTDNEHVITVIPEDIYGVKGRPVTRNFRVSLEEPKAAIKLPTYEEIVKGTVVISGIASDENGINRVQLSLDNGLTYNDAFGNEEWNYSFNSKILQDGTHVVFIKVWDNYDISAMYSNLINIDNTPPEVVLDSPLDGMTTAGIINITGRATDNIAMEEIAIEVRSLDGQEVPEAIASRSLPPGSILMETLDLGSMPDGLYNIEVWAIDKAENITRISRNIELAKESQPNFVDILYPLNGEHIQGSFNLYGITGGVDRAELVTVSVNGRDQGAADVSEAGYYRFALSSDELSEGINKIVVRSNFGGRETVSSVERELYYREAGAWVTIDTLNMGDFAYERPWLMGRAGYVLSEEDAEALKSKETPKDVKDELKARVLKNVDISFDNGMTFTPTSKASAKGVDWRYRLETGDMAEGIHYLIVRANMANGETAISRILLQVDKTPPRVRLIAPLPGGVYNTSVEYTALASDDVALKDMHYYLRKGDKALYEVPGFIQGLYFEFTIPPFIKQVWNKAPTLFAGGATYMDFGFGLSFFGDNVKVQAQYGFITNDIYKQLGGVPPLRYGGHVIGFKLLANLYTLPFAIFAGPDWEWLYASFALGANFSVFDIAKQGYTQSGKSTWLTALLLQIEFPKITIPKRTNFRTFSLFTEGQLWFVPTDVDAASHNLSTVIPHAIMGLRMYIF